MGASKHLMARREELHSYANEALKRAKLARVCHHGTFITTDHLHTTELPHAYAIGMNMIKAGEVDAEPREFTDAIKEAWEFMADDCGQCAKDKAA